MEDFSALAVNFGTDLVSTWIAKHEGHTEDPLSRKSMGM